MPGLDPIEIAPSDGPRQGIVTLREIADTVYERIVTFPDGSTQVSTFGTWSDGADQSPAPGPMGADAAARQLAETAAGKLLYCRAAKAWFAWDGAIWRRDRGDVAQRLIRATLRRADGDAGAADPGPRLVASVEVFARAEEALAAPEAWDADPGRLGTPGGTIDLTTGALHPADPEDRITAPPRSHRPPRPIVQSGGVSLDEATGGDAALAAFLQRFLGYALTGETCEHVLVYGLGEGGNGKSVFANTVRGILGDYAAVAAPDLFAQGAERRAGSGRTAHSTEIAMLDGARLVTASETEEGRVWADGRLKLLTGGDPVTARFLGSDPFTFTPRFKLLVLGNHMPVLRTVDAAIRRRLCIVPFATRPAAPDQRLEAKLKAEWPGILRWMIEGCLAWHRDGLAPPDSVGAATSAYLGSQDIVGQFLLDACETGPAHADTAAALYAAWCAYAKAAGEPPGPQRRFRDAAGAARHGARTHAAGAGVSGGAGVGGGVRGGEGTLGFEADRTFGDASQRPVHFRSGRWRDKGWYTLTFR